MKRGTPEHPKMLDLAEAIYAHFAAVSIALPLEACETLACGTLERLHHHAARYAAAGDIGKHSNARIAKAIGWDSEAEWVIAELCRLRWIDDDVPSCRLYIHDWHVHSDDYADRYLADNGLRYANGSLPRNKPRKGSPAETGGTQAGRTHHAREPHAPDAPPNPYPNPEPNPPPNPAARAEDGGGNVSWKALGKQLRDIGLSDADGALAGAEANGCQPIDVICLNLYWQSRPKCWAIGALHSRIKNARPGEPPENHWPEPSPEWNKVKRGEADSAAKRELAMAMAERQKQAEADRVRLTALEEAFGHVLDALPDDELNEIAAPLIAKNGLLAERFKKTRSKTALLREQLLAAVAERQASA